VQLSCVFEKKGIDFSSDGELVWMYSNPPIHAGWKGFIGRKLFIILIYLNPHGIEVKPHTPHM
jgi:hypothetical protein